MDVDPVAKVYDVYIDGDKVVDRFIFRNETKSYITQVTFWFDASAALGSAYIDDLKIHGGIAPLPGPRPFFPLADPLPPGGTNVLPKYDATAFTFGGGYQQNGSKQLIPVADMPFSQAMRNRTDVMPPTIYDIQVQAINQAPIAQGDSLVVRFYARSQAGEEPRSQIVYEMAGDPFTKSITKNVRLNEEWRLFNSRSAR